MSFDPSERDLIDSLGIGTPSAPYGAADANEFQQAHREYLAANPELVAWLNAEGDRLRNENRGGLFSTLVKAGIGAALPFAGAGLGTLGSAALGATTGAGFAEATGADPLIGALTGGVGGGLAGLGAANSATLLPEYYRASSTLAPSLRDSIAAAAAGAYQDRPDYDLADPDPLPFPDVPIIIGAPDAPDVDIPPPVLPPREEGPVGGGGGGGAPTPEEREDQNDRQDGTGEVYFPNPDLPPGSPPETWLPEGAEDPEEDPIDVIITPGVGDGNGAPDVGSGDTPGGGGSGSGGGQGSGDGAGDGSGSGDGAGDGSGSGDGLGLGSALGLMGLMGQSPGSLTAETPEPGDIRIYDLENFFGVSGLNDLYNAPFSDDELTMITEELLRAAQERR